ncbi:unnamed protein product [Closterium sp. Naga37s-1]|nr:unnamed protein product [Closterium sp. Naga37s-1]
MATTDRRPALSRRSRSHQKSPSTDSFLADSLSRFVETLAENDPSFSSLPPRHSPRSTLSPMSSSSSTPSAMRVGRRSLEIPSDADSSYGFGSPRDVPRRLAMRLLVGDSGGAVDAATTRVRTPEMGVPRGSSGRCSVNAPGTYSRELKAGEISREFSLHGEPGREEPQSRNGGSKAMFRSISAHVGPDTTTPFSPVSPATSASSPNGSHRNASSRARYLSRVGASEPLERTRPRKSRLNGEDDTDAGPATTGRDGTDVEEDSSDASVSMRRLGREMNELRKQLERCAKINKWLTESLRSAERTAAEATAAAQVAEAERDHVAKELEEVLIAWSQADNETAAKQEEERTSTERSRASLERARAVLAQEREAVGREREEVRREREELKREREALQKDKERSSKDAAERAAQEVQMEWSKLQQQAEKMGLRQHQHHHVTPDGVLLRSVSMNSTCSCLSSTRSISEARPSNEGATNQQPSKKGGSRSSGKTKSGASGGRWLASSQSESDLGACASRALGLGLVPEPAPIRPHPGALAVTAAVTAAAVSVV